VKNSRLNWHRERLRLIGGRRHDVEDENLVARDADLAD
jgi:hypothetical protein